MDAAGCGCSALAASASAQSPVEIVDGRAADGPDLSTWAGQAERPPVQQAIAAARSYWRGQDASYEEDIRFFGVAEGAFTEPGTQQEAVLIMMSPWPRCCSKMNLAVLDGGRLVRNIAFEGGANGLSTVPDLDGDGRDELAYTSWFGMGGQESGSVTFATFTDDGLRDLGGTSIYEGACAAGHDGTNATRVFVRPGAGLMIEQYTQPTCESSSWQPVGGTEPLHLEAPEESAYVELPVASQGAAPASTSGGTRHEQGRLAAGDETLTSGEYTDEYTVEGRPGQVLVVDLRATDFDPYLIIAQPDGEQLENDDFEGDQTRSQIATTLAAAGMYRVVVTSYAPGETGAYDLTISLSGGR